MAKLSIKALEVTIRKHTGNLTAVAKAFAVSRTAVYNYIERHPSLQSVVDEARETMKDNVVSRFYADCLDPAPQYQTSRIFFLKTQAKDRGYVERQEVTGKDGGPMDYSNVSDAELDRRIAENEARVRLLAKRAGELASRENEEAASEGTAPPAIPGDDGAKPDG